jgi:hypothetical protein
MHPGICTALHLRVLFGNDPSKITPLSLVNRITFFLTADIGSWGYYKILRWAIEERKLPCQDAGDDT